MVSCVSNKVLYSGDESENKVSENNYKYDGSGNGKEE